MGKCEIIELTQKLFLRAPIKGVFCCEVLLQVPCGGQAMPIPEWLQNLKDTTRGTKNWKKMRI